MRNKTLKTLLALAGPALLALAGCGNQSVSAFTSAMGLQVTGSAATTLDTNCAGCNAVNAQGSPVARFAATLAGREVPVSWSIEGGDTVSGAGSIDTNGQYKPPSFLTSDAISVTVTARLASGLTATRTLTIRPGFLQPLTPQNAALGASDSASITATLAVAGGTSQVEFALAGSANGTGSGQGSLGLTRCQRSNAVYTVCTATYTAPATLPSNGSTFVVATAPSGAKLSTALLLNAAGVRSSPAAHQAQQQAAILLGSSGGNNRDYDTRSGHIADCCGGTLGALVQDTGGHQFLLSNNHVLARSDRASVGESIVQPGLIDNGCTPYGEGSGTRPVATLSAWMPLRSARTNVDAAIAQVASGAVDPTGSVLELGARQSDGTLSAAPPGIHSSGGQGEAPALHMQVAKSGRTTGLTCGGITALALDVQVEYFRDCAETKPYFTKTFTNQVGISGNQFSDAGDSGALIVNAANAEPVGLYFAGGLDTNGVSQAVASPAAEVLRELATQTGSAALSFVGGADHPVSCLNYGDSTLQAAQAIALSAAERQRGEAALAQARMALSARPGILGLALGQSSDQPGTAALLIYMDEAAPTAVPALLEGLRTVPIPTTARAVAAGTAPKTAPAASLPAAVLAQAIPIKDKLSANLMRQNAAFFGVGAGQSLDQPREAAIVVYVDRNLQPSELPAALGGLRVRYVRMDRLHVTRAYSMPTQSRCRTR